MLGLVSSVQQGRAVYQRKVRVHQRDSFSYGSSFTHQLILEVLSLPLLPVQVQGRLCALFYSPSYDTVSYLFTHSCAPKLLAAALLPWAFKLFSLVAAFVLENKQNKQTKNNCPAAIRNGRPKLNLSFITRLNPIYC